MTAAEAIKALKAGDNGAALREWQHTRKQAKIMAANARWHMRDDRDPEQLKAMAKLRARRHRIKMYQQQKQAQYGTKHTNG